MKKYLVIHIIFLLPVMLLAQDETEESDTSMYISGWTLSQGFSQIEPFEVDTNLPGFQIFNPIYDYSYSNTYLSNIGTPALSNVFSRRQFDNDAFFLSGYMPYFVDATRSRYYNTTKPFSRLTYTNGGPNHNREQTFEAIHTQNITPNLNFAIRYQVISSRGQYIYQQLKKNTFNVSMNYVGSRYSMHSSFDLNRDRHGESGGVIESRFESGFIDDTSYYSEKTIPTTFYGDRQQFVSNAQAKARYYDFLVSQRLKLFTLASAVDTTQPEKARNVAEPILTYVYRMNRGARTYEHKGPNDTLYYPYTHFNWNQTSDSVMHFRITNMAQLEFKSVFRDKILVSIFGRIGNEYEKYYHYSRWDTNYFAVDTLRTIVYKDNGDTLKGADVPHYNSNFFLSAGLYGNVLNKFKARVSGTLYYLGDKAGETRLNGWVRSDFKLFNKDLLFETQLKLENKVPSYLLNTYYSNHYIWENQGLNSEFLTHLSGKIGAPSNRFELKGNYYLIRDHIYFNSSGVPENYGTPLNIISFELIKTFKLWKLNSVNKITYQVSENQNVLPLPNLVFFNSTYLDHTFNFASTGGKLQMILGLDTYYTTAFEGYEYSPALAQFYVQGEDKKLIGNYPIMDAYLSIKLKSARFFVKAEHFYGRFTRQEFYSAISYPYNRYALKFGFSWTFYD